MLLGLRGVGKTVLLNRIAELAEEEVHLTLALETPEDRRLAQMLVSPLRSVLSKLSRSEKSKEIAKRGLGVLRSFASCFKVSVGDIEFGVDPVMGSADSGDLEIDLSEVFVLVGKAAKDAGRAVSILIDEVQYLSRSDLSALITAIHRTGQKTLPCLVFGAGLPQLAALAGEAKSYAERLFEYPEVGPLTVEAAKEAIRTPMIREHVEIHDGALTRIVEQTKGYPYFLQEWGSHAWNVAARSPITLANVEQAAAEALRDLDAGFFRVRLDRLTPREKDYMSAMASLGPGPHRSGEIAQALKIDVTKAGPLRNGLIKKGMVYSPQHGDTAFTVPMFDEFLRRSDPQWSPSLATANPPEPRVAGQPRKPSRP